MDFTHKELAQGSWFKLTAMEQLGNIGSEVQRALNWRKKGNASHMTTALYRALDLIDLTAEDPKWRNHRLKELLRTREIFCDFIIGDNQYGIRGPELQKEFLYYAIAARKDT